MEELEHIRAQLASVTDPVGLLEALFAYAPVGIQIYRADGHCLVTNAAFRELFGAVPPPEYNILKDEIARAGGVLDLIHRAFRGETVSAPPIWYDPRELRQVHLDEGRRVAIGATFFPLRDPQGEVSHVAVFFKDVTAEIAAKEAAEARQREEQKYRFLAESMPQIVWTAGPDGRIDYINQVFARYIGVGIEHALETGWREIVHPDDFEEAGRRWVRSVATGEPYEIEYRIRGRDGVYRWFLVRGTAMRGPDGAVLEWFGTSTDVNDLKASKAEAEAASRSKDEFLAMLGHELRNPLAPIVTALHLMRLRAGAVVERERTVIERQVKHLTSLVDDLLDVSRITQGKVELKRQTVELSAVVTQAIEIASPLLEERRHRLTVEVPREGLRLSCDPTRLAQVIANLLTNAAKYTEPGGQVTVVASRAGDEVTVGVRDTGIGIAPQMLPRIFDLFVQERQELDRSRGGLGLGLAIVRSLVSKHGGAVEVRSEGRGKGSEFIVRLPAAEPATAPSTDAPRASTSVAPPAGDRLRILVVDDNEAAADLLSELLHHAGHVVRVAHDGPTALRLAEGFTPDLALLDIGLPVMDGYELAQRLRALPGLGGARLVAVTGYGQESDRARALQAGFDMHLVKPVGPDQIEALLRSARATCARGG